jgi:hypothetical protein
MKTKLFFILFIFSVVIATSCKKDSAKKDESTLTPEQLTNISDKSSSTFTGIETFMFDALSKAAASGETITMPPQTTTSAKTELSKVLKLKNAQDNFDWFGPDADGWYTKYWKSSGYTYTYKIRCKDTTMTNILSIEYSGGDGHYSNVYETQYTKYTKNKIVLWKGYADWKVSTFGQSDISDIRWTFNFTDWNPQTGAGIYDWFWGAHSLGGNTVPYQRLLNLVALEKGSNLLHVWIKWYDNSAEVGSWEYDTTWPPVDMPEMPCAL